MSGERVTIEELAQIVAARRGTDPAASYTAKLLSKGRAHCAKKFGEEAVELAIAAVQDDRKAVASEAADLMYHFVVLVAACDMDLDEVYAELGRRAGVSGHAEKASRKL